MKTGTKMEEKAHILIVDDDESTRKSLSLIFKKKGYETHTAGTGKEALAAVTGKFFNLALLDIRLPDILGIELIKPLKEINPDIAVIMATGFASLDTSVRALNEGAAGYITKPLNMDEVLGKVADVLEKQRLVLENRRLLEEVRRELMERKKAEAALLESETLLNEVGTMAHVGGWELLADTKEVHWTRETYRIHEVDEGESIRLSKAALFFDEPGRAVLEEAMRRGIEKGDSYDLELPFTSAKGRHLWTRAIGRAVTTNGKVVKLTGTFQDITEQKELEHERETTLKVLRSINTTYDITELIKSLIAALHESFGVEAVGIRLQDGEDFPYFETKGFHEGFVELERRLCAYDESGQLLRDDAGNPILECMCGNVIRGRFDPSKPFFTKNGSYWTNSTTGLLATTTENDRQARIRNRCNGEGYESVALVPLRYGSETFGLIQFNDKRKGCFTPELISLFERLSDSVAMALSQRLGEIRIRESEEKWRNLFESSKDVIYLSTKEGRFIDINRTGEELLGYTRDLLLEIQLDDIYKYPRDRESLMRKLVREGFVKDYEVILKKKNGELVDCLITATARKDDDGDISSIQGIIRDVSDAKRMGERILQMEKLSSLGGILSGVAHELNNPLTAIIGNAQLLTRKEIPSEYKEKLETIQKESIRCTKIVSGLLAFAREHKPERKILNINDIIMESCKLREYELRVDNVAIKLDLAADLPETAVDPFQFQQVFINLINNAHDALINKKGGTVTIGSRYMDGEVRIEFTDNGDGIPEENRKKIFDPFFTTKEVGKGTGLGLSIIYGIVAEHGGMIEVESKAGEYTKFIIELPVVRHVEPIVTHERKVLNKPAGNMTILIVDDEDTLREMITETLTGEGYFVESTNNGLKAVEILKKGKFDAVISDIKMPTMGGKELYAYLVNQNPDLAKRIIFITGDVLGQETQQFLNITGNRYIEKPFEIQDILVVLSEVLSND